MNSETASAWRQVSASAEVITQVARTPEAVSPAPGTPAPGRTEFSDAREALLLVTAAGKKLARLLDTLADRYAVPGAAEPSAASVALDQAAAAADDLGTCTKAAAQALADQE